MKTKLKSKLKALVQSKLFLFTIALLVTVYLIPVRAPRPKPVVNTTNYYKNSVMITNRQQTSGGTGIVMHSDSTGSYILTNDHVCQLVKNGGLVVADKSSYQVQAYIESKTNDLCLTFVSENLHQETTVAPNEPPLFTPATVSGHPALMPTVISEGKFSDKAIIQVMVGVEKCTEADTNDPEKALMCFFLGGTPIIRSYTAQLVSATIMPGSSGSGVYNTNNELVGVVFAGQGDFGYAWTMPYSAVINFLYNEAPKTQWSQVDQTINIFNKQDESNKIREAIKKCSLNTDEKFAKICSIIKKDLIWSK